MTRATISFAESALVDLEQLRDWYAEQGVPQVGERLVGEILDRIETLRAHPGIGRVVPEFATEFLRELIHPPFRIVYRREGRRVRVVRVWRGERELKLDPHPHTGTAK